MMDNMKTQIEFLIESLENNTSRAEAVCVMNHKCVLMLKGAIRALADRDIDTCSSQINRVKKEQKDFEKQFGRVIHEDIRGEEDV